ncbi:hypothetical protein QBC35DRAFT_416196 [Podospora australis]|uniref:Uncharacterized protein n=1 Tax=Podospora australis TaxID=1536484 RepID=A0AAN7ADS4_9PEZI|nr:hypothetical protein QBC35DRAFT_416196 [Podospora australis]
MNRLIPRTLSLAASSARTSTRPSTKFNIPARFASSSPGSAEKASAQSGGSRSKEAVETGSSPTAGEIPENNDSEVPKTSGSAPTDGVVPDVLAGDGAKGRTGGGKPLNSSHPSAPAQPKISNGSVPGNKPKLSKEQQAEVDQHNKEFEEKHGRAAPASDDKVNKSFWSGTGERQVNNEKKLEGDK